MKRGDPVTVVMEAGKRLVHGLVLSPNWGERSPGRCFAWATSLLAHAPVYAAAHANENITWCHGHISREAARPLLAAAALAWEPQ